VAGTSPAATPATEDTEPAEKAPAPQAVQPAAAAPIVARSAVAPAVPIAKSGAPEPDSPIRITTSRQRVHPQVVSAYQALQSGDFSVAQKDYQAVLKGDPKNTDALHGMAAINLQQGRFDAAESYYLRVLEADPKDSAAVAGLVGLRGQVDPIQSESRLKNLLASQPDSPFLNFALGNLYAQQGRWTDAQQAYFRAYAADSDNPDYQFNLAVSLDQMHQPKLALQYYQGALSAAAQRPAAFDRNQVASRVSELQK
jgi:tetratricopeptide (TPR) repeat protein